MVSMDKRLTEVATADDWWAPSDLAWEPKRADILRWRAIARDSSIRADEFLIRLDAKVTLFLERIVGSQTLYIYRN